MGNLYIARLCLLFVLLVAGAARADTVPHLYEARVGVADQSSGALAAAATEALAEVLVKVSGSNSLLQNPEIVAALRQARRHVQQYGYERPSSFEGGLTVRIEFDRSFVTDLVTGSGAPLWTANRPLVLAWVVVEEAGDRYFANVDTAPELTDRLLEEFSRRGVPVQMPLFDLADTAALNQQDVWRLDQLALRTASDRYRVSDILVGRISLLSNGEMSGDWHYLYRDELVTRTVAAADRQTFLHHGVGIVAQTMAARYAVAATGAAEGGVLMLVRGIYSYADYAEVISWLESLELIEHANIERVLNDQLEIRLVALADAAALATIIELNTQLLPLHGTELPLQLRYQWQNQ